MAAELAEGWQPIFYFPEKAADVWGAALAAGKAKRDPSLPPLDVIAQATLAIGDDVADLVDLGRPVLALYVGGMGARGQNFYTKLASRLRLPGRGRSRSRTPTWTAARTRRPRWSRGRCWRESR